MIPIIEVSLINELRNIVEITIKDDLGMSPAEHSYIVRRSVKNNKNDNVYSINQTNYTLNTVDGQNVYQLLEIVETTGIECTYSVSRVNVQTFDTETSEEVVILLAPSPVQNVLVEDSLSEFHPTLNLPTVVCLKWDEYNTTEKNWSVEGFNIYYSLANHNQTNWSRSEKLRGLSTDDKTSPVTFIDKADTSCLVSVPQLTQGIITKDIKLYLVATTDNKQSELSEPLLLQTKEFAGSDFVHGTSTQLVYGSKEDTDMQLETLGFISNPHYTMSFSENAFPNDTYICCEREDSPDALSGADSWEPSLKHIIGWSSKYFYNLHVDGLSTSVKVNIYYPTKRILRMDIRVNYGNGYVSVPYTYNNDTSMISFVISNSCNFVFLTREAHTTSSQTSGFSSSTKRMIEKLPSWSKIRKSPTKSNGAYFLEIFGMEFEEIESLLEFAKNQLYIPTSDLSQLGIIYKYELPQDFKSGYSLAIVGDGTYLEEAMTLEDFMKSHFTKTDYPEIYYNNLFMIDYDDKVVYTRRRYGKTDIYVYDETNEDAWYEALDIQLEYHKVWNFIDEFGLLMDVTRHNWESNEVFKERILDVFKNPSNASRDGLLNGIARELSQRVIKKWSNPSNDFIIKDKMVAYNKIKLNGSYVPTSRIWFTDEGYIVIKSDPTVTPDSEISYVVGIELRTLHSKDDIAFRRMLYNQDGTGTKLLEKYVGFIKNKVPIEWGKFHWNIGYWDTSGEEYGGVSYLPSLLDAKIDGFYDK